MVVIKKFNENKDYVLKVSSFIDELSEKNKKEFMTFLETGEIPKSFKIENLYWLQQHVDNINNELFRRFRGDKKILYHDFSKEHDISYFINNLVLSILGDKLKEVVVESDLQPPKEIQKFLTKNVKNVYYVNIKK